VQKISEARCVAPDTAIQLGESIYAFTDQGVVRVSDAGVNIISRPIEDELLPLYGTAMLADVRQLSFAIAYESSRLYILFVPSEAGLSAPDHCLVYNTATQG
jgi:hypothetical protein